MHLCSHRRMQAIGGDEQIADDLVRMTVAGVEIVRAQHVSRGP